MDVNGAGRIGRGELSRGADNGFHLPYGLHDQSAPRRDWPQFALALALALGAGPEERWRLGSGSWRSLVCGYRLAVWRSCSQCTARRLQVEVLVRRVCRRLTNTALLAGARR